MARYTFVSLLCVLSAQILPILANGIDEAIKFPSAGQILHSKPITSTPRDPSKGLVIAHALLCVFGFAICLPGGAILARYLRTSRPWWYTGHWVAQIGIGGPVILIGVILGYMVNGHIGKTPDNIHKDLGNAVFYLYIFQCHLGAVIHFFKPKNATRRPIQNYFHAILGLTIIFLGMYQIHTGYDQEWPRYKSLGGKLPSGVNGLWIFWFIAIVGVYAAGLWYLRKQYAQEAAGRRLATETPQPNPTSGPNYSMNIMKWRPRQETAV